MKAKLFLAVFLTIVIAESINCDFSETDFETKRKDKNIFVLFEKEKPIGSFNYFYNQVKNQYDDDKTSPIKFEKVDCSKYQDFCAENNVTKLLELKYFPFDDSDNKKMFDFLQDKITDAIRKHEAEEIGAGQVNNGTAFVKFYSSNCPACKGMAEEWVKIENQFQNKIIKIVSINCDDCFMLCKRFKILKYPTFHLINNGIINETYTKEWKFLEFSNFLDDQLKLYEPKEKPTEKPASYVMQLTPENFNKTVTSTDTVFVKFTLKGCIHCTVIADAWEEAAEMASDVEGLIMAEMECAWQYAFCLTQRAKGFPTLNVYKNGVMVKYDFHETMTAQGFYDCAIAYHTGGEHLEKWTALQKELRSIRKAKEKAVIEELAKKNMTIHDVLGHH